MSCDSELKPPKMFSYVTSKDVTYNMDFVSYLMQNEMQRRAATGEPALSKEDLENYKKDLIKKVVISKDVESALKLRPSIRRQLNG